MTNLIVALPKPEDAKGIKNVLVRGGFRVTGVCTTGAQVISQVDGLGDGIVICGYKLADMVYSQLRECLPPGFEMLLLASDRLLKECGGEGIVCLSMPLKVNDLISTVGMMEEGIVRRRRKARSAPKARSAEETALLNTQPHQTKLSLVILTAALAHLMQPEAEMPPAASEPK